MKKEKVTLIKPKKENKNKELILPIVLLIVGIILLTNSTKVVIFACYLIGATLLALGIYNLISYYNQKKQFNYENNQNLLFGVILITGGLLTILLASTIEELLRVVIGIILIIHGIKKIFSSIDKKNYLNLFEGVLLIIIGLYTMLSQNVVFMIVGIILIIASVIDFIDIYKQQKK